MSSTAAAQVEAGACPAQAEASTTQEERPANSALNDSERAAGREAIVAHLESQGFRVTDAGVLSTVESDKDVWRSLHGEAVVSQRERARKALQRHDRAFTLRLANGDELVPRRIRPRLIHIEDFRSPNSALWRWCSMHWSIPVSSGYGRRLRFLVVDEAHNDSVIGLIGLADPVFSLGARDREVGWTSEQRAERLSHVMEAFVLGAVAPYNELLGGKLIASLLSAAEVQNAFDAKYAHRTTLIAQRDPDARLAMITTNSALGRSSIYNRVRRRDGSLVLRPVGFTNGSGDFHFSGAIYDLMVELARKNLGSAETQRHSRWGGPTIFRNRREVIQRALEAVDLNPKAMRIHGVQRQIYLAPLATNTFSWLRGEDSELHLQTEPAAAIGEWWRERWAIPRSESRSGWQSFDRESWRLYPEQG
ncbi:Druantia anti-phage system protein DruA [Leifsonia sp. Root227]|uniref:Druantia anti-phage system protein DruA n=1 Tax=Leifsonia sp. Root227 TaxID=1736496 RepID=UPI00138F67B0|nr:Druantia anti-phage system protein DruA [Leifsonia sp. Root227]